MGKVKLNEESMNNYKEFMDKVDKKMIGKGLRDQMSNPDNIYHYEKLTMDKLQKFIKELETKPKK